MNERELAIENALKRGTPNLDVFIVDDSELARIKLERLMVSFDWRVADRAVDGEEAVHKFKTNHKDIDLVTLDVEMPRMNGIVCLQKMLEIDPTARIVMVTSKGDSATVRQAIALGAKHFIVKPFQRVNVMQAMIAVMSR
jgi:two-component system, chemotaxis family, chemotaxis protein CheY